MYQELQFRRQFILTFVPMTLLAEWKCFHIDQYYLYAHPDLVVNWVSDSKKTIALIGEIYDSEGPEKGNRDILNDILISADNINCLFLQLKNYTGCYALLYKNNQDAIILHDARALREIYYCTKNNQIVCGSQPNLVSKFSYPEIKPTTDPDLLDFCNNHLWDSRWVGDETYYENVKHLLPNHYLDITRREASRYWPNEPINRLILEEAVSRSCTYLQGILKAIVHRHPAMMAVTAGTDSRTLLAASKAILDKIYYFINNHGLGYGNPDISVPNKIFESIRVQFHVHDVPNDVDEEFRQIYFNNIFLANERMLTSIYNIYFKNHSEKIFILGVGEIGRTFYGKEPKKLTSFYMAYKLGYNNCHYVISQCEKILNEILPVARKYGLNVMALFYWEQRLGNWGAVRNSESNIAIEKIDPYDSHFLNEIFMGVDEKYRHYQDTPCIFFREMIRNMWPELLKWPINPPYTIRDKLTRLLIKVGVFELLKDITYLINYLKRFIRLRF